METHSSVLAWRIPWMEKPGRLQSAGSQSRTQLKQLRSSSNRSLIWSGANVESRRLHRGNGA